ncbi:Chitin synthase regulatory factor 3-like protein [Elsinoe fawcettii]|nr:Chitin synthase regulatory factor 3-like protein [Elsinoe fawcettii]
MAYDQHAAYQAPGRHYYPQQQQQQAPVQQRGYDQGYDQRYDDGYGYQDRGRYDQGYAQDNYGQHNGQQRGTPRMRQEPGPRGPPQDHGRGYDNYDQGYGRDPRQVYQQPQYANSMPQNVHRGPQSPTIQGANSLDLPRHGGQSRQRNRPPPLDRAASDNQFDPRQQKSRRPLIEPVSPTEMPQDNAFPTFPVAKKKPSKAQLREGPAPSQERPGTASGGHRSDRPGTANGQNRSPPQMNGQGEPPRGSPRQNSYESREHHDPRGPPSGHGRPQPQQQRSYEGQGRPGPQHQQSFEGQGRPHPQHQQSFVGQSRPGPQHQQSFEGQSGPPAQHQQSFDGPRQMNMPIRPGTAPNAHRGPPMNGHAHPQGPQHVKHNSQSEIYADYYGNDLGGPHGTPRNRDEEIEQDMPDFDGPSSGHKRGKTIDEHLTPASEVLPPMPRHQTPYHNPGAAQSQPSLRGTPGPGQQRPNGNGYGPASGIGPHPANQPPQPYQNQYASRDPYANSRQAMGTPTGQQSGFGPRPPVQRPGTADAYGRPSMDRNASGGSGHSQPGRAPSAPPMQGGYGSPHMRAQNGPPMMSGGMGPGPGSMPPTPASMTSMSSNPDSLPHHPAPFRPGLDRPPPTQSQMSNGSRRGGAGQPLNINPSPSNMASRHPASPPSSISPVDSRRESIQGPVTHAEINHLQSMVNAHPQDFATALLLAKRLVEASTTLASENGRLDARQTSKNRERYIFDAHRRVKKLVSAGYPDAMFYLADCYGSGLLGLEEDPKEAFALYQQAAKLGHGAAAYRTAVCCEIGPEEGGGTRRDVVKAVQWYRRAAQLQDVSAMFKLGVICLKGLLSQQKNIPEAERWLKRAAEKADKDNPHALHELALLYEPENPDREVRGKIVGDEKYSRELFFKAAELGWKGSQCRLGQAFEYGALGLPVDARSSIAWYSKAAAQGDHAAELALSGWYLTGAEGILENSDQEAYLWARKAASADPPLAKAMFAMGYYTETGIGCPANLEEAKRWYGRAASYKFPKAIDRLEEIKRNGGKIPKEQKGNRLQRKDMKGAIR